MSTSAINTQASILERAMGDDLSRMTPDAARFFLTLKLDETDERRANELAEKARGGSLSNEERVEIDEYRRVGRVIEMLRLRARIVLNHAG